MDIFAPGVNIASAIQASDAAVGLKTGTSMAAPFVSGELTTKPSNFAIRIFHAPRADLCRGDIGYQLPTALAVLDAQITDNKVASWQKTLCLAAISNSA